MSPEAKAAALGKVWDHLRVVNSILRTLDKEGPGTIPQILGDDCAAAEREAWASYSESLRFCQPTRHLEEL